MMAYWFSDAEHYVKAAVSGPISFRIGSIPGSGKNIIVIPFQQTFTPW